MLVQKHRTGGWHHVFHEDCAESGTHTPTQTNYITVVPRSWLLKATADYLLYVCAAFRRKNDIFKAMLCPHRQKFPPYFCVWIKSHRKTTYNTTRGVFQQHRVSQVDWRQAVTFRVSVSLSSTCSASAVAAKLMLVACYDRLSVFLLTHNKPVQASALFFSYLNVLNPPGLTTNTQWCNKQLRFSSLHQVRSVSLLHCWHHSLNPGHSSTVEYVFALIRIHIMVGKIKLAVTKVFWWTKKIIWASLLCIIKKCQKLTN